MNYEGITRQIQAQGSLQHRDLERKESSKESGLRL